MKDPGPRLITAIALLLALTSASCAAVSYSGSLRTDTGTSTEADKGIVGANFTSKQGQKWIPLSLRWVVSQNIDQSWHYQYSFDESNPRHDQTISHIIVEVSPTFTVADMLNFSTNTRSTPLVGNWSSGASNPSLPSTVRGIKLDGSGHTNATFGFDSFRAPVWGDFYVKQGSSIAAWNRGFTAYDVDPLDAPRDGSVAFNILRPDTTVTHQEHAIPELPAPLLGALAAPLMAFVRRRIC